ncbi:hypothetical protein [Hydrogenimonas cancrithermarum]|uniref:Uncharacterized protein n=1 Tax=Hydrogenimonas cancrithermarum TaxID=2993563 RepID=A0ABN6WVC7_9BACT|nr:hypothetical protein [Hydrogenimonas cancrithermarum]BDY13074.1 hypothetical protein HCR_13860 [Hydrogenimonas cancrithermarum]
MIGNGSDFASCRGGSTQAWPKPRQGEATKRGGKIAPPVGWPANGTLTTLKMLDVAFGYALRFSSRYRTICGPFPVMWIFEMGSKEEAESVEVEV